MKRGERGWWSRNRLAVVLVPVLLVLALAANGQRVVDYWWPSEPHARVGAGDGPIRLTTITKDANGEHDVAMRVSYVSTKQVTRVEPAYDGEEPLSLEIPSSVRLWKITLHFAADPDTILSDCNIGVVDADGRDYDLGVRALTDALVGGSYSCVPAGDPGPQYAFAKGPVRVERGLDYDEDPRPASWDYSTYVVMPKDRRPDRVRVWLRLPHYAQFTAR